MSSASPRVRLEALQARDAKGNARWRLVTTENGDVFMLDQAADEPEETFREGVQGVWLEKSGGDPAGMPAFR